MTDTHWTLPVNKIGALRGNPQSSERFLRGGALNPEGIKGETA